MCRGRHFYMYGDTSWCLQLLVLTQELLPQPQHPPRCHHLSCTGPARCWPLLPAPASLPPHTHQAPPAPTNRYAVAVCHHSSHTTSITTPRRVTNLLLRIIPEVIRQAHMSLWVEGHPPEVVIGIVSVHGTVGSVAVAVRLIWPLQAKAAAADTGAETGSGSRTGARGEVGGNMAAAVAVVVAVIGADSLPAALAAAGVDVMCLAACAWRAWRSASARSTPACWDLCMHVCMHACV